MEILRAQLEIELTEAEATALGIVEKDEGNRES